MDNSIYIAAHAANLAFKGQQVHSNNLAHSTTVGYKSEKPVFFDLSADSGHVYDDSRVFNSVFSMPDVSQGPLVQTANSLDLAIEGEGHYFSIQIDDDNMGYTRDGIFSLTADGVLVTVEGYPILGPSGTIQVPDGEIQVDRRGEMTITMPDKTFVKRQLGINYIEEVVKRTDGLFEPANGYTAQRAKDDVSIRSGMLEESNVNSVQEMVEMLDLSRYFEIQLKYIQQTEDNSTKLTSVLQVSS